MGQDANEIRREIEATRARMGDTVEALGYKADVPARVKDAVYERVETVKGTIGEAAGAVKNAVGAALGGAKETMTSTLGQTTEKVSDVTSSLSERAGDAAGGMTAKLGDARDAAQRGVGMAVENPLGLALGALAVGILAGLVAPVTEIEREKVGPIRDELLEKAQTITGDVIEHGKQVLQETAQAVVQSAQTQSGRVGSATEYGALLEDRDSLEPGAPGTASP
ncbi:MAG TPA: DUF3618 domain-containing protein [Candidatus Elarobacter sp.]|jgi:hypothetical protein|nr:DUF3618 domain-containing protein [Candidatus Elarobacter sp.]